MEPKVIILSAPSGSGKTTIAEEILNDPSLKCMFSVSAASRNPRPHEKHGKHYYFLSPSEFRDHIKNDAFVEWEEVYADQYYGTLRSEVDRIWGLGYNILFDVDVKGGMKLKNIFGKKAMSMFIMPPSVEELEARLRNRQTENEESLKKRIQRSEEELEFASQFDVIVINDNLEQAIMEAKNHISFFTLI